MNTNTNIINPGRFLDSSHGAAFWRLCDKSLIRRQEAEAIVSAVAHQVARIKADPTDDDIASALPDRVDDDDEHAARRRRVLAIERLARHAQRLGAGYTVQDLAGLIADNPRSDLAIWYDVETIRQRALCTLHDRLTAQGMDALAVLAAGEAVGMVPSDD